MVPGVEDLGSRTLQLHSWLLSQAVSHWVIPRVLDVCLVGFSWRNCNLQYGHLLCNYLAPRARNISQPKVNRSCAPIIPYIYLERTNSQKFFSCTCKGKVQVWNQKLQGKVLSNVRKVYFLLNLSVATVAPVANKRTVAIGCAVVVSKMSRLGQVHVRVTGVFLFHILDCHNMSEHVRTY